MGLLEKQKFWMGLDEEGNVSVYLADDFLLDDDGQIFLLNEEDVTIDVLLASANVLSTIEGNEIVFEYDGQIFLLKAKIMEANDKNRKKYFKDKNFNVGDE